MQTKFLFDFKQPLALAVIVSLVAFSLGTAYTAWGNLITLSVTVNQGLTFVTTTTAGDNFPAITPGSVVFATTTLDVATNDTLGYFIVLSGNNKSTGTNNLQSGGNSIPDQKEWINPSATTSAGNAVRISAFTDSISSALTQNVLAYRVMTASGTQDMRISSWWGTADNYVDNANTLWAGISSSTGSRKIINTGAGSYQSTDHLSTVSYYLSVAASQAQGSYTAPLTYTATGN